MARDTFSCYTCNRTLHITAYTCPNCGRYYSSDERDAIHRATNTNLVTRILDVLNFIWVFSCLYTAVKAFMAGAAMSGMYYLFGGLLVFGLIRAITTVTTMF